MFQPLRESLTQEGAKALLSPFLVCLETKIGLLHLLIFVHLKLVFDS